jgi:outer membrane protein assembly factor BamB
VQPEHDELVNGWVDNRWSADPARSGDSIDLGELGSDEVSATAPWRPPRWFWHGVPLFAVVILVLLGLHASAPRLAVTLGEPLWTANVNRDPFSFGSEAVVLVDGGHTVVAHDPRTGAELWRREFADQVAFVQELGGGFTAVQTGAADVWTSTLVASRTGDVLLESRPGGYFHAFGPTSPARDEMMLVGYLEPGADGCPAMATTGQGCTIVEAVRAPGGETVWHLALGPGDVFIPSFVAGQVGDFATVAVEDGRLRLHDVRTAAVTATMSVGPGVTNGVLTEDTLIISTETNQWADITAYDRKTFARRWQQQLPVPPAVGYSPWAYLYECDRFVCAGAATGTTLMDPVTGDVELVLFGDQAVYSVGANLVLTAHGPGRSDAAQGVGIWNVDDRRLVREYPNASIVNWFDSGGRGLLTRPGSEGTSFILIDEGARTRLLGTVPDRDLGCEARGDLMVCTNYQGDLTVWELPA